MKPEIKSPAGWFSKCLCLVLAALLAVGGSGCQTYKAYSPTYNLWDVDTQPSFCRPQADLNLALFNVMSGQDFLVVYNCGSERHPGNHRRAYFLEVSRTNIAAGQPPQFVNPKLARGLTAIPVRPRYTFQANPDPTNIWAKAQSDTFILYRPGQPPETNQLPCYQDYFPTPVTRSGKYVRAALTPITVAVEVVYGVAVGVAVIGTATAMIWVPFAQH